MFPCHHSDWLLINVSANPARGMISGDAWDGRESLVHASLVFLNRPKTEVDSGSLCVWQQCPVTATTDTQALREQISIKSCSKRVYINGTS